MALTPPWLPALQRATAVLGHKLPEDAFLALVLALATHRPPDHPRHILLAAAEGSAVPTVATIVGRLLGILGPPVVTVHLTDGCSPGDLVRGATTPLATTLKEQVDAPAGSAAASLAVGRSFEFALLLVTGIEAASPAVQEALLELLDGYSDVWPAGDGPYHTAVGIERGRVLMIGVLPHDADVSRLDNRLLERIYLAQKLDPAPPVPQAALNVPLPTAHLLTAQALADLQAEVNAVTVTPAIVRYLRDLIVAVRYHHATYRGGGLRSSEDLAAAAKALAWSTGTAYVTPTHVVQVVECVLGHRVAVLPRNDPFITDEERRMAQGTTAAHIIADAVRTIPPPV